MDRRRFLALSGGLGLASLTASPLLHARRRRRRTDRVLVLGAGMAGITTAQMLVRELGFDAPGQVRVLEAGSRVGGRLHAQAGFSGGARIDMGATWIHGHQGNPLTRIADRLQLERHLTSWEDIPVYGSDGSLIPARHRNAAEWKVYASIAAAYRLGRNLPNDQSFAASLDAVGAAGSFTPAEKEASEYHYNLLVDEYSSYMEENSTKDLWAGEGFGGGDAIFTAGFASIPEAMARGLDILLDTRVEKVEQGQGVVRVTTDQGIHEAERVVVAVPLGVLKAGSVDFQPGLPQGIEEAIDRLGFGSRYRLVMEFPNRFWDAQVDVIGKVGRIHDDYGKGEHISMYPRQDVVGRPILSMDMMREYGNRLEQMGVQGAVRHAMQELRTIYGPGIPNPTVAYASDWHSNPLFRGSYSGWPTDTGPELNRRFRRPIGGRLFFAGEHTDPDYTATVHGAMFSGQYAARQVRQWAN